MVWYSYLLKNFPQFVVIQIVKGFSIVKKQKYMFLVLFCFSLEFSCFFYDSVAAGQFGDEEVFILF